MAVNKSVELFRQLTENLKKEVHDLAVAELNSQADQLVSLIASVAPKGETGDLSESVRKVADKEKDTIVRVVAGGHLTIEGSGYDYARAMEFGTQDIKPQPFFYPTYRLRKKKIIAAMKRKIVASIKKRSAR